MNEHCYVEPLQISATPDEPQATSSVLLAVGGLGCTNCATRVQNGLLSVTGVVAAHVLPEEGLADVTYNPELTNVPALIDAVAAAGDDGRHHYTALALSGPAVTV
jgi:copper chaperone CopZ